MSKDKEVLEIEEFKKKCKKHHLKITPQRVAIYKELLKSNAHPSADMMYRIIRKDFPNMSFDTVNRTLLTFKDIGLIDVLEVQGGPRRYEPNLDKHHHFYCQRCGKIIDLFQSKFDPIRVPEDVTRRFEVHSARIAVSGLCDKCRSSVGH